MYKCEVVKLLRCVCNIKEWVELQGVEVPEEVFGPVSCLVQYSYDQCESCDGQYCSYLSSLYEEYKVSNYEECVVVCCGKIKVWLEQEVKLQGGKLKGYWEVMLNLVEVIIKLG